MRTYLIYKAIRKLSNLLINQLNTLHCRLIFWGNNIHYQSFRTTGIPLVSVAMGSFCQFGNNLMLNNGPKGNLIGCFERCTFFVDTGAKLIIGNHVGMSQAAIVCHTSITIGDHVKIGGGVCIYDTDFHSLDPKLRAINSIDLINKSRKPVSIGNNVFIGAHSLILKGVSIGENSIVGAGSVVSKSIPANQIWAGNPAKFIRNL